MTNTDHTSTSASRDRLRVAVIIGSTKDLTPELAAYGARLDRADAFVVVTPEYNHGIPASLKHAIDCAQREWYAKLVGFVSYGGIAQGLRAVEQLRLVFAELHAVTLRDGVNINIFDGGVDNGWVRDTGWSSGRATGTGHGRDDCDGHEPGRLGQGDGRGHRGTGDVRRRRAADRHPGQRCAVLAAVRITMIARPGDQRLEFGNRRVDHELEDLRDLDRHPWDMVAAQTQGEPQRVPAATPTVVVNLSSWAIPLLDHATRLLLLRKVGHDYIFVHRELLNYLADLFPDGSPATANLPTERLASLLPEPSGRM